MECILKKYIFLFTYTYHYTRQKKKLLAFSFANFETTSGSTWKANAQLPNSKSELHWPKKFLHNLKKIKLNKRGVT